MQQVQSSLPRPPRELKGFRKVPLKPSEKTTVEIPLPLAAFAYYDPARKAWVAEAGDFVIHVGNSSRNLPLHATYRLAQTTVIKD